MREWAEWIFAIDEYYGVQRPRLDILSKDSWHSIIADTVQGPRYPGDENTYKFFYEEIIAKCPVVGALKGFDEWRHNLASALLSTRHELGNPVVSDHSIALPAIDSVNDQSVDWRLLRDVRLLRDSTYNSTIDHSITIPILLAESGTDGKGTAAYFQCDLIWRSGMALEEQQSRIRDPYPDPDWIFLPCDDTFYASLRSAWTWARAAATVAWGEEAETEFGKFDVRWSLRPFRKLQGLSFAPPPQIEGQSAGAAMAIAFGRLLANVRDIGTLAKIEPDALFKAAVSATITNEGVLGPVDLPIKLGFIDNAPTHAFLVLGQYKEKQPDSSANVREQSHDRNGIRVVTAADITTLIQELEAALNIDKNFGKRLVRSFREELDREGVYKRFVGREWLAEKVRNAIGKLENGGVVHIQAPLGFGKTAFFLKWCEPTANDSAPFDLPRPDAYFSFNDERPKLRPDMQMLANHFASVLNYSFNTRATQPNDLGLEELLKKFAPMKQMRDQDGLSQKLIVVLDGVDEVWGKTGDRKTPLKVSLPPKDVVMVIIGRAGDSIEWDHWYPRAGIDYEKVQLGSAGNDQDDIRRNTDDIRDFVEGRIKEFVEAEKEATYKGNDADAKDLKSAIDILANLKEHLIVACDGQIFVASESLKACYLDGKLQKIAKSALEYLQEWDKNPESMPRGAEMYVAKTLDRIIKAWSGSYNYRLFFIIAGFIAALKRPLRASELKELLRHCGMGRPSWWPTTDNDIETIGQYSFPPLLNQVTDEQIQQFLSYSSPMLGPAWATGSADGDHEVSFGHYRECIMAQLNTQFGSDGKAWALLHRYLAYGCANYARMH